MRIIGITGGVASGKSAVAEQFRRLGAGVIDADRTGHEVLRLAKVEQAVRQRWGSKVFGPDGRIDRARLARIVFAPGPEAETERKYLEQLTHPEIAQSVLRQAEAMVAAGVDIIIVDAALLLEAGWDRWCEKIIFVEAPRETRLSRAVDRGWKKEDFEVREGVQESLDQKRASADVIIDNSGPPQRTQAQVERFWASLVG
jgi:dephospho-CoA kinase